MQPASLPIRSGPREPLLLYAVKEQLDPESWRVGDHVHAHHEVLLFQKGHQCTRISGHEEVAGPGEVFFFRAGTPHEEWLVPSESVVKYTLGFDWDVDVASLPHHLSDGSGRLTELADWMCAEAPGDDPSLPPAVEPLVHAFVGELRRAALRSGNELRDRAQKVLSTSLANVLSVEDLAGALGMSRSHLSRRFVEEAGVSPSDFIRSERLKRARFLLRNTSMAVKEVASAVGVSSEQQMCRLIREAFGVTTTELRCGTLRRAH